MIALAFVAFQIAAAAQSLVVRDADHAVHVPVVATANGPMVRPEALEQMIPIQVQRGSPGTGAYSLEVWGTTVKLDTGVAIAWVGDDSYRLTTAPVVKGGSLMVPLQLVTDILPSVAPNMRWDADSSQLVLFTSAATAQTTVASAPPPDVETRPAPRARAPARTDASRLPPAPPHRAGRHIVIVDAGHGGVDNGMTGPIGHGPKIYEKNITLAVAKKLGAQLQDRGVDVVYTRTTDTLIALDDRGRIANRAHGDLFISIHVNAANPNWKDPGGSRGFETYFLSEAHTEDARRVEQMENGSARYDPQPAATAADPLSFMKADMLQNEYLRESSDLADIIQQSLGKVEPGPSRGVKQAGFRVLVTAYMPSVLVEIGFGTNPREAAYISDPANQDAIAGAIADGAMEYLRRYDDRTNGAGQGVTPPK